MDINMPRPRGRNKIELAGALRAQGSTTLVKGPGGARERVQIPRASSTELLRGFLVLLWGSVLELVEAARQSIHRAASRLP